MRLALLGLLVLLAGCTDNRRVSSHLRDSGAPELDGGVSSPDAGPTTDASRTCGDGVRQPGEQCDRDDLAGASCASLGLGDGTLACGSSCAFDASGCASCVPSCATRECGPDGCGGSCGGCGPHEICDGAGLCQCAPSCAGRACGDDGCGGSCGSCGAGASCADGACVPLAGGLRITEVFYDAVGGDDQLEWVELHNASSRAIDLSGYSLGAGGSDYTYSIYALGGTIPAGGCIVVGGPLRSAANGAPVLAQAVDFAPDIQNSGSPADGVALFAVPASGITAATIPIDAVIYGDTNASGLLDETGTPGAVDVADAPEGGSIERERLADAGRPAAERLPLSGWDGASRTRAVSSTIRARRAPSTSWTPPKVARSSAPRAVGGRRPSRGRTSAPERLGRSVTNASGLLDDTGAPGRPRRRGRRMWLDRAQRAVGGRRPSPRRTPARVELTAQRPTRAPTASSARRSAPVTESTG